MSLNSIANKAIIPPNLDFTNKQEVEKVLYGLRRQLDDLTGAINASGNTALAWSKLVLGSAQTTVTTNGEVILDGNAHGGYEFEGWLYNTTGGTCIYSMFINGDLTATNYTTAQFYFGPSVSPAAQYNDSRIVDIAPGSRARVRGSIGISPEGLIFWEMRIYRLDNYGEFFFGQKNAVVTNLERIDFSTSANGIGINSRFRLKRFL